MSESNLNEENLEKVKKIPAIDENALKDIEKDAELIASNFYKLTNEMKVLLNQISATSVCCTQTYKDSIDKLCDSIDEGVVLKRDIITKAQELSSRMRPIYELQTKLASIKRLLDAIEIQI